MPVADKLSQGLSLRPVATCPTLVDVVCLDFSKPAESVLRRLVFHSRPVLDLVVDGSEKR